MADPEKVKSETLNEDVLLVDPGVILGWNKKGKFLWGTPCGLNPFQVLALLEKAKQEVLEVIPSDKVQAPLVAGVPAGAVGNLLRTGGLG